MNKDISDKEVFAQKIAQEQDSGLTSDQKNLVKHIEQAIETNKEKGGKEIDYHRYWKDMYEKEHKLRLEAEGETHLVKAVGMNSPEMKEAKSKIKELELGLANALAVNESHQKLNGKLQGRLTEVEEDNKKLASQVEDKVNQLRTKGIL